MAGQVEYKGTVTQHLLDALLRVGLAVEVLVDLSHSAHFRTKHPEQDRRVVERKPIELDITVKADSDHKKIDRAVQTLLGFPPTSAQHRFGEFLQPRARSLAACSLKVGCPNFDHSIFDLKRPPPAIRDVVEVCLLPDQREFNSDTRERGRAWMGMYERRGPASYVRRGGSPTSNAGKQRIAIVP